MVARYGNSYAVKHRANLHRTLLEACRSQPGIELETNRLTAG
jgi:3-hydroxybenzoate 6-monooxygenase